MSRRRLPRGFRVGHCGDLACPHHTMACCATCAAKHDEIIEVYGQHFWEADPVERAKLRADIAAEEAKKAKATQ